MKKFLLMLVASGIIRAEEMSPICMNWKDSLMNQWQNMSTMHKLLFGGLLGLAIIWIVWRLIACGNGGCGCHCNDKCSCKL
jgi:hypothetical protein